MRAPEQASFKKIDTERRATLKSQNTFNDNSSTLDHKASTASEQKTDKSNQKANPLQVNINQKLSEKPKFSEYEEVLNVINSQKPRSNQRFMNDAYNKGVWPQNESRTNAERMDQAKVDIFGSSEIKNEDRHTLQINQKWKEINAFNERKAPPYSPYDNTTANGNNKQKGWPYITSQERSGPKQHFQFMTPNRHTNPLPNSANDQQKKNSYLSFNDNRLLNHDLYNEKQKSIGNISNHNDRPNNSQLNRNQLSRCVTNLEDTYGSNEFFLLTPQNAPRRATLNSFKPSHLKNERRTVHNTDANNRRNDAGPAHQYNQQKVQTPQSRTNVFRDPLRSSQTIHGRNPLLEMYNKLPSNQHTSEELSTNLYFNSSNREIVSKQQNMAEQLKNGLKNLGDKFLVLTSYSCKCDFISLDHRSELTRVQQYKQDPWSYTKAK